MKEIEHKVAIVTGGGSGIGRAIALRFARAGARVAVLDVAEPAARDVAREIEACGGVSLAVPCDVSPQAHGEHAFQALPPRVGPADIILNSARIPTPGNPGRTSQVAHDRQYTRNRQGV